MFRDRVSQGVLVVLKYSFLACVVAAAVSFSPAVADTASNGAAGAHENIQDIRYAGSWNRDGRTGVYRVVIMQGNGERAADRLFVQWISQDNGGELRVEDSIEINEIAAWGLDIVDYVSQSDSDGLVLFMDVVNPHTRFGEEYELFVMAPNEYRLGIPTN